MSSKKKRQRRRKRKLEGGQREGLEVKDGVELGDAKFNNQYPNTKFNKIEHLLL